MGCGVRTATRSIKQAHVEGLELFSVVDKMDVLSLEFPDWRFNLRASNTEPLLWLNIDSRGKARIVRDRLAEIQELITRPV